LEERALVEALAAHPPGDLVVALARVARAARGHDVLGGVAPAAGDGKDAVLLERDPVRAAVRAALPRLEERLPLGGREVVRHGGETPLAASGVRRGARAGRHAPDPSPTRPRPVVAGRGRVGACQASCSRRERSAAPIVRSTAARTAATAPPATPVAGSSPSAGPAA